MLKLRIYFWFLRMLPQVVHQAVWVLGMQFLTEKVLFRMEAKKSFGHARSQSLPNAEAKFDKTVSQKKYKIQNTKMILNMSCKLIQNTQRLSMKNLWTFHFVQRVLKTYSWKHWVQKKTLTVKNYYPGRNKIAITQVKKIIIYIILFDEI